MRTVHWLRGAARATLTAAAVAASGCIVQLGGPDYTPPAPVLPPTEPASAGAIYQESLDVRLFEDLRAHRVGDILTVRLAENTNASKQSSTAASKSGGVDIANPTLFGRNFTRNGDEFLSAELETSSEFEGSGTSTQSNRRRTVSGRTTFPYSDCS